MQTTIEKSLKHTHIKGNGKLLISGEYFVLDGAKAFALPCKYGQVFDVIESPSEFDQNVLIWKAYNSKQELWLETNIKIKEISNVKEDSKEAGMLSKILRICKELNPTFLSGNNNYEVTAQLEFPNNWGLGSSSTLIYFIAKWANINPYTLLEMTFGGSGYDIACAENNSGIFYTRNDANPIIEPVHFSPSFKNHIYFVHLNAKMNSRNAIQYYKQLDLDKKNIIKEISNLSECFVKAEKIEEFEKCMFEHELLLSKTLNIDRVKNALFKDYWGEVKSLGAWGGDFVMLTNDREEVEFKKYLNEKGFDTIVTFDQMILNANSI